MRFFFFFFNDTATTEIYTLSLHDALPIYDVVREHGRRHLDIERRRLADRGDLEDAAQAWRLLGAKVGGGDQDDEGRSQDERSFHRRALLMVHDSPVSSGSPLPLPAPARTPCPSRGTSPQRS